jgi:hypothetical protein
MHTKWIKEYGPTLKYTGLFGVLQALDFTSARIDHVLDRYRNCTQWTTKR